MGNLGTEEQEAVVARRIFAQISIVCQLYPFLNHEALFSYSHPSYLQIEYCNVLIMGQSLNKIQKFLLVQNVVV